MCRPWGATFEKTGHRRTVVGWAGGRDMGERARNADVGGSSSAEKGPNLNLQGTIFLFGVKPSGSVPTTAVWPTFIPSIAPRYCTFIFRVCEQGIVVY